MGIFIDFIKRLRNNRFIRIFTIILSAVIWGLGQYPQLYFIRFFGLILFIYEIDNSKRYKIKALIFGTIAYSVNFYWLLITFYQSGKMHMLLALSVFTALCIYYGLQYLITGILYKVIKNRFQKLSILIFPLIFVMIDFVYIKIFNHQIADSLIGNIYLIQFIDITGITGLSLLIIYFNTGLYLITKDIFAKRFNPIRLLLLAPLVPVIVYGVFRYNTIADFQKNLPVSRVAMIQGNISGKQKLDENFFETSISRYNDLTKTAVARHNPELIVWPESIFNRSYDGNPQFIKDVIKDDRDYSRLNDLNDHERTTRSSYPYLIMGIVIWKEIEDITNSALLIKNRRVITQYDKQKLVPFGEFVPFEKFLPFLRALTPFHYNTRPGNTPAIFSINEIKAAISICYEDIFPSLIRKHNIEGSNLMINITNDSWYGKGLGPLHHSILGRLRAIENRRSFYRCTATGFSTASDLTGRIINQGEVWKEQIIYSELPIYDGRTFYSYTGDIIPFTTIVIAIFLIIYSIVYSTFLIRHRRRSLIINGYYRTPAMQIRKHLTAKIRDNKFNYKPIQIKRRWFR